MRGVSIPFIAGQWSLLRARRKKKWKRLSCLNPLHCGAVVASASPGNGREGDGHVSIPFIAGQWSLLIAELEATADEAAVSIPFIAGQWSLRGEPPRRAGDPGNVSIPFIAGQWSLQGLIAEYYNSGPEGLNPLHCGAVVASRHLRSGAVRAGSVSIPFIAGQWSLLKSKPWLDSGPTLVSIPFIAGQWSLLKHTGIPSGSRFTASQSPSLRGSGRFRKAVPSLDPERGRLNPLHCGAVVASWPRSNRTRMGSSVSIPFIAGQWSLRRRCAWRPGRRRRVSIPFIAGQWSLLRDQLTADILVLGSQSPSLRGSGRFRLSLAWGARVSTSRLNPLHCGAVVASKPWPDSGPMPSSSSQSPSLRGSGRFEALVRLGDNAAPWVSIPFIAGQWSLRGIAFAQYLDEPWSQSPSLRGSGRFSPPAAWRRGREGMSQSPSLRGSGRFVQRVTERELVHALSLNPLHCGAVVASWARRTTMEIFFIVSIPFIAGQWSLLCNSAPPAEGGRGCFNPLHCGAVVASARRRTCC